jgi:hypothetical protein
MAITGHRSVPQISLSVGKRSDAAIADEFDERRLVEQTQYKRGIVCGKFPQLETGGLQLERGG